MAIADNINWRGVLKDTWLLWDSSAVIKAIQFESEDIFAELASVGAISVYISPVELELLATKNKIDKLKRSRIMAEYLILMSFHSKHIDKARELQAAIGNIGQPSAADLYIGAMLAVSTSDKFFMITHNVGDFPAPYFKKECFVTMHTDTGVCSLTVLSFDKTSLQQQKSASR